MLNISEEALKQLLEKRKGIIERKKLNGLSNIVTGFSFILTIMLGDFNKVKYVNPQWVEIFFWAISTMFLICGVYQTIKAWKRSYSVDNLYSEIADLDPNIEHAFNIVAIRSIDGCGKYLIFKSQRWKCWLFPNYHCLEEKPFNKAKESRQLRQNLIRDLDIDGKINIKYIGDFESQKYSYGDKVQKKYRFHVFDMKIMNDNIDSNKKFQSGGKTYCWKTLDQMYADKNITKKNKDVLDYLRKKLEIC